MTDGTQGDTAGWSFATFRLLPFQMSLTDSGVPVRLGSRAFALLVALVERAGDVVTVDELMARAWPNVFVEEVTFRVHLHALKKVLGGGRGDGRFIVNETGRGYRFVAPVCSFAGSDPEPDGFRLGSTWLPARISRMVGRDTAVDSLRKLLHGRRLLTLVGPGGVGKTTVAIAIAERLRTEFLDQVYFLDLTSLSDPAFVASTVAGAFKLSLPKSNGLGVLAKSLADRRLLLVLDNCEHVVGAAAELAEQIHRNAPNAHVLCTSREPLRADGEWIYRLSGLTLPPNDEVSVEDALQYDAIRLFVERMAESQATFQLSRESVGAVCRICRRLDGIPLALELAAASLHSFSLIEFSQRLEDCFALLTEGRRTAAPRHQTMRAALDWSHALLSVKERIVFRRLAVFRATFDLPSAIFCCTSNDVDASAVTKAIGSLTAKSLLNADVSNETTYFRLLESTRAYARDQLAGTIEDVGVHHKHAELMLERLLLASKEWRTSDLAIWRSKYGTLIDDIRAAIDWSFGPGGAPQLGVEIVSRSGMLAFEFSLLTEFLLRYEAAYAWLPKLQCDASTELRIVTGLSHFMFHAGGPHERAIELVNRAVQLAEQIGSDERTIDAMASVWVMGLSVADYRAMERAANAVPPLAARTEDALAELFSARMGAVASAFSGDLARSGRLAQGVFNEPCRRVVLGYGAHLSLEKDSLPTIARARAVFLQGNLREGMALAQDATEVAGKTDHQQTYMIMLGLLACPMAFWLGDWVLAGELIARFNQHIDRYSATYYRNQWAIGYERALRLCEGGSCSEPSSIRYHTLLHDHLCTVHQDFVTPAAVARSFGGRAGWCTAEIYRAEGNRLRADGALEEGESLLRKAIDVAGRQNAKFWQLRATTDLATHLKSIDNRREAIRTLEPIFRAFENGPEVRDVSRAAALWSEINASWV